MNPIGKVISLSNPVFVEGAKGKRWRLYQHNSVFIGDRIFTGKRDKIEIQLSDNSIIVLENGQSWTPTEETRHTEDGFFVADATISDSAKGEASLIEQLLQRMLVDEVTSKSMRSFSNSVDLLSSEMHFAERWTG
ncbi:MAG: hypothetical protein HRU06_09740 [Oceanospirillaceae bacterium]|nr:hypothetical protein [Oceanospirillaceae bacterium]